MKSILNRRNFFAVLVALMVMCITAGVANCGTYSGGTGEPNNPYLISTAEDMNVIGADSNDWDKHFKMTADINMAGYTYTTALIAPDTDNTSWYFDGTPFAGTFNGSNHSIHNLTINAASTNDDDLGYIGLFGQLRSSAVISNLRLENINVICGANSYSFYVGALSGSNGDCDRHYAGGTILNCYSNGYVVCGNSSFAIGGMVGCNYYGTISNCYATGSVSGNDYIGGMLGWNFYGDINNCHTNGDVVGIENSHAVGGVVGYNEYGNISNCHSNSHVSGGDSSYAVGGVVGQQDEGTISNCYANGSVNADYAIGNLVGKNSYGSISNCYSTGTVTGQSYPIGGLVGYNYGGTINNCYAADSVSGGDNSTCLGGLVGWNEGTITDCYAAGSVTGGVGSYWLGGLAGRNGRTITNCYASGAVSSGIGSSNLAGLCGYQWSQYYTEISNCFWDTESTGMSIGYNLDPTYPGTITNVFGKTTAEMQLQSTFTDYGWDFNTPIWKMCDGPDYPKLGWEECPEPPTLLDVVSTMLDPNSLKNENMKNALLNKIDAALAMIDEGQYQEAMSKMESASSEKANRSYEGALNKLENDILAKTDGCAETGEPDKNDWITSCEEQTEVYPLIIETIEYVRDLME